MMGIEHKSLRIMTDEIHWLFERRGRQYTLLPLKLSRRFITPPNQRRSSQQKYNQVQTAAVKFPLSSCPVRLPFSSSVPSLMLRRSTHTRLLRVKLRCKLRANGDPSRLTVHDTKFPSFSIQRARGDMLKIPSWSPPIAFFTPKGCVARIRRKQFYLSLLIGSACRGLQWWRFRRIQEREIHVILLS